MAKATPHIESPAGPQTSLPRPGPPSAPDTGQSKSPHTPVSRLEVDIQKEFDKLKTEAGAGERGHRQQTLYHHDSLTIAIFGLERSAEIPQRDVNGVVSIYLLKGRVKVTNGAHGHELCSGKMLVLAPREPYAVFAEEESEALVTVHLIKNEGNP
jgi:quercetin dioxygenase-like cupin family protein